jgi:O-antigen/teichoic acid export membrane protein
LVNAVVSFYQSVKCGYRLQLVNPNDAGRLLREYAVFPKVNLLPALMSTICFMLPVVFINKYYSAEEAGYFDLSKLILSVPLALVASSFSSVVLNKTAERYRNKKPFIGEIKPLIGLYWQ